MHSGRGRNHESTGAAHSRNTRPEVDRRAVIGPHQHASGVARRHACLVERFSKIHRVGCCAARQYSRWCWSGSRCCRAVILGRAADSPPAPPPLPTQERSGNRVPTASGSIPARRPTLGGNPVSVDVAPFFTDPDGDTLKYSATSSNPRGHERWRLGKQTRRAHVGVWTNGIRPLPSPSMIPRRALTPIAPTSTDAWPNCGVPSLWRRRPSLVPGATALPLERSSPTSASDPRSRRPNTAAFLIHIKEPCATAMLQSYQYLSAQQSRRTLP